MYAQDAAVLKLEAATSVKTVMEAERAAIEGRLASALDTVKSLQEASASGQAAQHGTTERIAELQNSLAANEAKAAEV